MKKRLLILMSTFFVLAASLFIWLGIEIASGQKPLADGTNDYAIILGAKVKPGGEPSLSLKNRLDAAVSYLVAEPHVTVVVSGGQGEDEDRSEASVMRDYLVAAGIDEARIILEEHATSTFENLLFSIILLPEDTTAITIISNDFHLRRASFFAANLDLQADVVPAATPASVKIQSHLREHAALLKAFVLSY